MKYVPDPENYSIILRFLGTTPETSSIVKTFKSIFYQISRIFNFKLPSSSFESHSEINNFLIQLFTLLYAEYPHKKLVIILDSLDQLAMNDYSLDWLLTLFPPNVKMIYSTIPDHGNILRNFQRFINIDESNLIEITSLTPDLANLILKDWLKKENKLISASQHEQLNQMFSRTTALYPLYIKILFDIVSTWPSTHVPDEKFLNCRIIDDCIKYLFSSLEIKHGKLLFSRTITYMTLFKNGISESELEDVLSLDDDVLYDIFEFHAPPVRKLPIALWSRIKHDLKSYLVEKEIDNTRVIYW